MSNNLNGARRLVYDASKEISKPGSYTVTFKRTAGEWLLVERVAALQDGKELAWLAPVVTRMSLPHSTLVSRAERDRLPKVTPPEVETGGPRQASIRSTPCPDPIP